MKTAYVLLIVLLAAGTSLAVDTPAPADVVAVLQELRAELEWPGLTADEAATNLKTPQEAFRFVRDEIVLVCYRGSYAGVEGTLRTRVANATDKAMLLAILLQKMKIKVRMARSDWPEGAVPHQGPGPRRPLPALDRLAELVKGDAAGANSPASALTDKQLQDLRDEITASEDAIRSVLTTSGGGGFLDGSPAPGDTAPGRVDTNWVWVQAQLDGKTWTDMDPVFPERDRPAKVQAPYGFMPVAVTIRVEGGRSGQEKADPLLQWRGSSHDVLGHDLLLSCFPAEGGPKAADEPQKVVRWKPVLTCGSLRVQGNEFAPAGNPVKPGKTGAEPAGGGAGLGGLLGGAKEPAPKPQAEGYDFLTLVIEVNDNAEPNPWSASFSRVVQFMGSGYDANELVAVHRIILNTAFVPVRAVEGRMVDEVLDAYQLRRMADQGDAVKMAPSRGYSSRSTKIINSMFFLKLLATPTDLKLAWQGPAVFLETCQLRQVDGQRYFVSRLDTLHEAFGPQPSSSRRQRALWGLATAASEALMLKTTSVNRHLLASKGSLGVSNKPLSGRLGEMGVQKSVLDAGGVLVAGTGAPGSVWALKPSGDLLGVFIDTHAGVSAKGAGSVARSEAAGNAFAALGDGAMSVLGCPAGMLVTPLAAYSQELAKAYVKAASVLDGLAKTIETGDDSHMKGDQDDYFKNLGRHLTNALGRGFVKGWAENVAGAGIGHALGSGGRSPMADRVIDGLVSTDLSLPPEIPVFTSAVERAMDAVTIPPAD